MKKKKEATQKKKKVATKKTVKAVSPKKTVKKAPVAKTVAKKKPKKVVKRVLIKKKPKAAPLPVTKKPTSTKTTGNYLSKAELMFSVMESKKLGRMSDSLAFKLQLLTAKYAKSAQWGRYTYNEDMQAYAMMMLVRTWNSFNPEKSDNPFAFFTQCIKNSFIQYLNQEKRQRNIRDELLVDQGLTPSLTFQMEHEDSHTDDSGHSRFAPSPVVEDPVVEESYDETH